MSLLLQIPLPTGMVICVDKRHSYRGGHIDDHEKFLQVNQYWALVLTGTVGIDSPAQVAIASSYQLERIEGFLSGKRPIGGFVVADTVVRFFRAFPPPDCSAPARFPMDYPEKLEFECILRPTDGISPPFSTGDPGRERLAQSAENKARFRQSLEDSGFYILQVRQDRLTAEYQRAEAYQCTLRTEQTVIDRRFNVKDNEAQLRQKLEEAGFRVDMVRQEPLKFADEDATFVSDGFTDRAAFEEGFAMYYISRLLDWIEEDYRNYLAEDKEEAASLATRSHWTGLPVLTATLYGMRRDATFFAKCWLLEIRPGTSMPAWWTRRIDLTKRMCAIGDVQAFSDLLGADARLAGFLVEPRVSTLQEICKGMDTWRGMLLADRVGPITIDCSEAAAVLRRVCEITHESNKGGPTSAASDCFFFDYAHGIRAI